MSAIFPKWTNRLPLMIIIGGGLIATAVTAGVFLYRLYFWFVPIPLAWILLKVALRGKSMLPTTGELKAAAHG